MSFTDAIDPLTERIADLEQQIARLTEALRELEYEASYELGRTASGKFPRREFGFAVEKARAARKSGTSDD